MPPMRFVFWTLAAIVGLFVVVFAASNRQSVAIGLWPLVHEIELPLYLLVIVLLIVGFFAGRLAGWFAARRWRREARERRNQMEALQRELAAWKPQHVREDTTPR